MKNDLLRILRLSKSGEPINNEDVEETLQKLGVKRDIDGFHISREMRIRIALQIAGQGVELEKIIDSMTWKDFEGIVAAILSKNEYRCIESFRRRSSSSIKGMEIDVIGVRGRTVVSIDAKMWNIRSGKSSALKRAAEKQRIRTQELAENMEILADKIHLTKGKYYLIPILVTWLVEDLMIHEEVPIVPIFKFNTFIMEMDQYEDMVISFKGIVF